MILELLDPQNGPPHATYIQVLLNDTGEFALGLLARLQPVLQRPLHLGSAGNGGVQLPAGRPRGAEPEGVFSSLGEQEDSRGPGTLGTSCRHLGEERKGLNTGLVLRSKISIYRNTYMLLFFCDEIIRSCRNGHLRVRRSDPPAEPKPLTFDRMQVWSEQEQEMKKSLKSGHGYDIHITEEGEGEE